ncbi:MAG: hypothetical protein LBC71_08245 [Oscillospiraceae bacterium]|jgi:carbon starvation protein CstA|nr:hypothetical protein [Oscillospiraceae bacterium]
MKKFTRFVAVVIIILIITSIMTPVAMAFSHAPGCVHHVTQRIQIETQRQSVTTHCQGQTCSATRDRILTYENCYRADGWLLRSLLVNDSWTPWIYRCPT